MRTALILGSGPSAAAAALALTQAPDVEVTVVDLGLDIEPTRAAVRARLAGSPPDAWSLSDLEVITEQPVTTGARGLPEKRAFGSDYPFRDAGQLAGLAAGRGVNPALVSAAYGGFSTVWGAQLLPFPTDAFRPWPIAPSELEPHYRAVLEAIPFAAVTDDLAEQLPLYARPDGELPLSPRAAAILDRYADHRGELRTMGLTMGRSRLAVRPKPCCRCGLCMTGCPYSAVYCASQTFDQLRRRGRIRYRPGLRVVRLEEDETSALAVAQEGAGGPIHRFAADRVYVACGAVGTARLVLDSLREYGTHVPLHESAQFVVPFLSGHSTGDPRRHSTHALGQLSALFGVRQVGDEPVHLQLYTYNPAFVDALPGVLRHRRMGPLTERLLARLCVGIGYLPSSVSPGMRLVLRAPATGGEDARLAVSAEPPSHEPGPLLRAVGRRLTRFARHLDLWPAIPRLGLSAVGKSYHWGGSFPHSASPGEGLRSDRLGRVRQWRRVHLVDASVLPSLAATTFTLTVMANAHRISSDTIQLSDW